MSFSDARGKYSSENYAKTHLCGSIDAILSHTREKDILPLHKCLAGDSSKEAIACKCFENGIVRNFHF